MPKTSLSGSLATITLLGAVATAQAPSHAKLLNGSSGAHTLAVKHTGDVMHVFGLGNGSFYSRSADGGRSWPMTDVPLGTVMMQDVHRDGDLIALAGYAPSIPSGPGVVVSHDLGLTWSPVTYLDTWVNVAWNNEVAVHVDGLDVLLLWTDTYAGSLWSRLSTDGGLTWPTARQLVDYEPPASWPVGLPAQLRVIAEGQQVVVFWLPRNTVGTPLPAMQVSSDGGRTWLPQARTAPALPPAGLTVWPTSVAGTPDSLLVSQYSGPLQRSTDRGLTWTPVPGMPMASIADLAADDGNVVVVSADTPQATSTNWMFHVSTDGGATFGPAYVINAPSGFKADAQVVGDDLYVALVHNAQIAWSTLLHSDDGGASWHVLLKKLNTFAAGPDRNLIVHKVGVLIAPPQLWGSVDLGYTLVGDGTPGTGFAVPSLHTDSKPRLGTTFDLGVTDALAGTLGIVGLSWDPVGSTPLFGGVLRLQGDLQLLAFATDPTGTGTAQLTLPTLPALAGARLTGQAAVLDPAATSGVALSNGVEIWLR
ncbi:MAG: sialidase family protein [Planctomycetota bacterium]